VEGTMNKAFIDPVLRLCESLSSRHDVDESIRLRIVPAGEECIVEATLPDGRVALRRVRSPDDLAPTVDALVLLPPRPPPSPEPKPSPPPERPPPGVAPQAATLNVEAGAAFVVRLSGAPAYASAGAEAYAGVRHARWLFALTVRYDPAEDLVKGSPSSFEMETVGAGFWFARRLFGEPSFAFDLGANASLLSETQSAQRDSNEVAGSMTDVRLGLTTRASFGRTWAFAPSLTAEISPARLRRDLRIDQALPVLPAWSVGIGIGASWVGQ
jgi:hypothetical protein